MSGEYGKGKPYKGHLPEGSLFVTGVVVGIGISLPMKRMVGRSKRKVCYILDITGRNGETVKTVFSLESLVQVMAMLGTSVDLTKEMIPELNIEFEKDWKEGAGSLNIEKMKEDLSRMRKMLLDEDSI